MFKIDYDHTNYAMLIKNFACNMKAELNDNRLIIPEHIGAGYYKHINLSNGLQCLISNYVLNQDMYLMNKNSQEELYTLRFDQFSISNNLMIKIDQEYLWEGKQDRASVYITSNLFDYAYLASQGSKIKSINVLITRQHLAKYFNVEKLNDVFKKYLLLNTANYNFVPFDVEYKSLFDEAVNNGSKKELEDTVIDKSIITMVERFLSGLNQKLVFFIEREKIKIRHDEVKRLIEAESYLIKNFSAPPPSIPDLCRAAAMSSTSFKNKFKKLYGDTVYEYFQKKRMQRANILLLTRKYSIKEIGTLLGYTNLSNFTIAFKKEYNRLPSQSGLQI